MHSGLDGPSLMYCRSAIGAKLDQDVNDETILIDGTP
jgi:hypothetical protein